MWVHTEGLGRNTKFCKKIWERDCLCSTERVIEVIMFDRIWEMLESISAGERRKAFDAIVELLSFSKDEEMLQLRDDLIAFEEDITDESEDPIKSLLENTYTKKEAPKAKSCEKHSKSVSEGLIMPVNPVKNRSDFRSVN
jgi:hypothetical protein